MAISNCKTVYFDFATLQWCPFLYSPLFVILIPVITCSFLLLILVCVPLLKYFRYDCVGINILWQLCQWLRFDHQFQCTNQNLPERRWKVEFFGTLNSKELTNQWHESRSIECKQREEDLADNAYCHERENEKISGFCQWSEQKV